MSTSMDATPTPGPMYGAEPLPKSQFPDGYLEDVAPQPGDGADLVPREQLLADTDPGEQP
jgi:hypothetical protein